MVNIVGDHATYHKHYDAQLESDIETVARNVSAWIRTSDSTEQVGADAAEAVAAALGPPGQIATLILPADASWATAANRPAAPAPVAAPVAVDPAADRSVAKVLRSGEPAALLLGGAALRERGLVAAQRVAAATGVHSSWPRRSRRASSAAPACRSPTRLAYLAEFAAMQLEPFRHLVLVDAKAPVSFFAYPGKPSDLVPDGCEVPRSRPPTRRRPRSNRWPTRSTRRPVAAPTNRHHDPERPTGPLTAERWPPHRRAAARGRDRVRRGQHPGCHPGATAARRDTTGSASPAAPSARACRSRSAPRWPRPIAA